MSATVNGQPAQGFENSAVDNGRQISLKVSGQSKVVYSYTVDNVVADSTEGREVSWPIVQGFGAADPEGDRDRQHPVRDLGDLLRRPARLEHALYFVPAGRVRRAADRAAAASRRAAG